MCDPAFRQQRIRETLISIKGRLGQLSSEERQEVFKELAREWSNDYFFHFQQPHGFEQTPNFFFPDE